MTSDTSAVSVHGAIRHFGGVRALDGADIEVPTGKIVGLIGPNGAGKSTLVSAIGGQLSLSSGSISLFGVDISQMPAHQRAQRGLVRTFQLSSEFNRLTVLENLLLGAQGHPGERFRSMFLPTSTWRRHETALVEEAVGFLDIVGLAGKADEYAGTLSGGQKRLLEITRSLMSKPRVLLLDEPTAGVALPLIPPIESCLSQAAANGVTMVLVEHELSVVERLCDQVVVMARGQSIGVGTLADVRQRREVMDAYVVG